ncbi:MAG: hypothetical protein A3J93_03955 [Candidatus Magasanikbacteria bacterium RIFOXYC2_FULL_42_28]|uniref:Squalene cyclase C-terminal domain-containing protein n=1 Tax=Candidatus Magasanikbacteria bacterium RIFOXYC2_FULL_42_28 TaxID=1798704 RepID=A0A1F6NUM9_9BACT|nr:MAG: hypothetical protein A3J93_03955 [Candidatus Magasanikbacteria bacterium RIFOXYC2_FULL_42_28]
MALNNFKITAVIFIFGLLLAAPVYAEEAIVDNSTASSTITTSTDDETVPETTTAIEDTITTPDVASSTPETATTTLNITSSTPDTASSTLTNTTTTENTDTPSGSSPTNQTITAADITNAIQKILNYLKSQQNADGKILDGNMTDWAIMSFGADGQYADEIKNATTSLLDYETNYNLDDPSDLNPCASYPRHVLALLSTGVSASDVAIQGLKDKMLTVCYQNNLYGLNGINDDVFGLIALLALDTNQTEPIIQDIVSTTLSWQSENGAFSVPWGGTGSDITGATINALQFAKTKGIEIHDEIFNKAKNYLKSKQLMDGGWNDYGESSDIITTSWILMGINALGENQNEWFNSAGKNPWHPLINQLSPEGRYISAYPAPNDPTPTDWFGLQNAVPALAGKFWPIILPEKITHFETGPNITYSSGGGSSYIPPIVTPTTTPTSTVTATTTTSTVIIATTTLASTTVDNAMNNLSIQTAAPTSTTSTPKLIIKKITKPIIKPTLLKPEIKGEKITAPVATPPPTNRVADQPKTKKNPIMKAASWIWGLLKNLIQ